METFRTVIMAAGKGTRMESDLPKVAHKLNNKPMVTHVVEASNKAGADNNIIIVGYKKDVVKDCLSDHAVSFAVQEEQLGTGHAVMMAKEDLKDYVGTVIVLSGDVPLIKAETIKNIIHARIENGAEAVVATAILDDAKSYGRIIRNDADEIIKIVEAKDASEAELAVNEINSGIYAFDCEKLIDALDRIDSNNNQNEYYLTDTIKIITDDGGKVAPFVIEDLNEITGVNTVAELKELEKLAKWE